jgi:type II secretory pathway pseudopilin PulG
MKLQRKKKNAITLLEIMIVIFLIGLIGSVIGYNVKGSMEEGKAFRTEQGAEQIRDILSLEASNGTSLEDVVENPEYYLKTSGLCKNYKKMQVDGWGQKYEITLTRSGNIKVESAKLKSHLLKKKAGKPTSSKDEEEDEEIED